MSVSSVIIDNKVAEIKSNLAISRKNFLSLSIKCDPNDSKDKILLMLWSKVIKDLDAFTLLIDSGLGESGAKLLRSVYHSYLWMRWILIGDNVVTYQKASEYSAIQMMRAIFQHGLASFDTAIKPDEVKNKLKQEIKKESFPRIEKMAVDTKVEKLHALIYPMLSAIDHGNMMFMGERLESKIVSIFPDELNIIPFFYPANLLLEESALLCKEWIENDTIRPFEIQIPNLHFKQ